MTTEHLTSLLEHLRNGTNPITGASFDKQESCLRDPAVVKALNRLIKTLVVKPEEVIIDISDAIISEACTELRTLGYHPCVMQLAKVFIGSRSIVDRNLKALSSYNRYRGVYTRPLIHRHLMEFHRRQPNVLLEFPEQEVKTVHEPWKEVDFFQKEQFDKMDSAKERDFRQSIVALGLRKPDEKLPEYMAKARQRYPRAYEPWTREEQSLLIEAMCYTNQPDRLAAIFGRSVKSVTATGQRLIWDSQEAHRQRAA